MTIESGREGRSPEDHQSDHRRTGVVPGSDLQSGDVRIE